jgi:hypothetical protein
VKSYKKMRLLQVKIAWLYLQGVISLHKKYK